MNNPQRYARNLSPFVSAAKDLFKKYGPLLRWNSEPESLLDLAIGDGRITNEVILPLIPKNVREYVGADISETMLHYASKTIKHDKFKTLQLDMTTSTIPTELKNRFDHIISSYSFQLISNSNIRQTFDNIYSMLKPGGQFFFTTNEKTIIDEVYDKLDEGKWNKYNNRKAISPFYRYDHPSKEYENLMKISGFVDCQTFSDHITPGLPEKAFEDLMVSVNIRLPYVEEDDRQEYLNDYLKEIKKSSMVEIINDDQTRERIFVLHHDVTTGIASKLLH